MACFFIDKIYQIVIKSYDQYIVCKIETSYIVVFYEESQLFAQNDLILFYRNVIVLLMACFSIDKNINLK